MGVKFACASLGLAAAVGRGEPVVHTVPVALEWDADGVCDVRVQHGRRGDLGLVDDPSGTRRATITMARAGLEAVHVHIELAVEELVIERDLDAADCTLAADAAMLVVGAQLRGLARPDALDPPQVTSAPEPIGPPPAVDVPADEPEAARPAAVAALPPRGPVAAPTVRSRSRPRLRGLGWLGAIGGAAFGPVPKPSGALGLVFAWQWTLARLQLDATHVFRRTVTAAPDVDARLSAWSFAVRAGVAPRWRTLRVPVLLGLELIDVVGSPRGDLLAPRVGQRAAIQLALDAGLWWSPWPRLALGVHGAVSVALLRAGFEFGRSDGGAIAVPPGGRVGGRVGASLAVRLR
ncbi:MAG: hypothetical protein IPK74_35140 [Deltaproteobacteria bacterium]|nr:hypothetical protein [Deltaproteobacteria bacterium]